MTTARRRTTITYSGAVDGEQQLDAADNTDSPAQMEIKTLAPGINIIASPTGGTTPTAVTIVPPPDNEVSITLKGHEYIGPVATDTGIQLHPTDPTTIAFPNGSTIFILDTTDIITGVRFYWS